MRRLSHMHVALYIFNTYKCASIPNTFHLCILIHAHSRITKSQQQYTTISIGNLIFVCDFFEFYGHLKMATSYLPTARLFKFMLCEHKTQLIAASELLMCPFKFDAMNGCTCVSFCCTDGYICLSVCCVENVASQNFL